MAMEEQAKASAAAAAEVDDKQLQEIVRSWILQALSGEDIDRYRKLLSDLKNVDFDDSESVSGLAARIRALSQCVSIINERDHEMLLSLVFSMSFWSGSNELLDAIENLVVNLATSSGVLVPRCLDMLVRNFLPPSCGIKVHLDCYTQDRLARKKMTFESLKGLKPLHLSMKNDVMNRVHLALQRILELVPIAALRLHPIVQQRMPHRRVDKDWNSLFLENMLLLDSKRVSPAISSRMLLGIVDRLIEIDVEIAWEDILKDEDSSKVLVFHMDVDESDDKQAAPGSEAQLEHALAAHSGKKPLDEIADKMDHLMELVFEHLHQCAKNERLDEVYTTLMVSFKSTVLDTYKSKFTQFLIFYLCSLSPSSCGANFAGFLCETFVTRSIPSNTRMSAAAYLASYLARANFLPLPVVLSSVSRLVNWCVSFTPTRFDVFKLTDTALHGVFYAACQAVMYILCFRLRELYAESTQRPLLKGLRLQQLIEHKLCPLKVCLPSVVEEFVRQATAIQLISYSGTVEPSSGFEVLSFKSYGGDNRLEMFFPFDPYLLRRSDRFIEPIFTHWSAAHSANEVEEQSSDEEEPVVEEEEVLDPDDLMEAEEEGYDDGGEEAFRNSLECMSITPPRMLPANLAHMLPIS
ncbi:hypothetical protein SELMODRAFT_405493 [Selaginella moellendorffii]|uniref:RNA polymerase I-specific transcription initiation factor RRN3 n=1 Tax=Selaginella moellendorffii TaxID=88036 RepID=D8QYR6_SELML|nr:RNA polymerase I-specific transcription initiation factor RRN3 [Selaginella moellendorffii]EFJ34285.1 hypothetical protein SELMODRAFT_405493 [Selaginella moellendorffii]|eukprot:XP_002963952.1 RNA polymerase I-specific transcription initiation factor RRN3 [Selaginella moellendorffii]